MILVENQRWDGLIRNTKQKHLHNLIIHPIFSFHLQEQFP